MIKASELIKLFLFALEQLWGYIWGTAGIEWTQARQNQKVQYMVDKYGKDWKKNADAKNDTYYKAALYGAKWIGHIVADCSGLFVWAFKKLGGAIYHGSNSIYDRYCSEKGKLTDEKRKNLLPGTAVFVDKGGNKSHIGLYVGKGKVIEAAGTEAGVCTSNLTANKWTYYGLLKGVTYDLPADAEIPVSTPSEASDDKSSTVNEPTLRKGNKGDWVTILQNKLMLLGYALPKYGADGDFGQETLSAVKAFQKAHGLLADGVVGKQTWAALNAADPAKLYTITVKGCTKAVVDEIQKKYGGEITAE